MAEPRESDGRCAVICADALAEMLRTIDPQTEELVLSGAAASEVVRLLRMIPGIAAGTHVVVPVEAVKEAIAILGPNYDARKVTTALEDAFLASLVAAQKEG